MQKESCLKIIICLLDYLERNPTILMLFPEIGKRFVELLEKSNLGTTETDVTLYMKGNEFRGQIMLQNWMDVAGHFGNLSSLCLSDIGHVALETKKIEDGMSVTIYFQPR